MTKLWGFISRKLQKSIKNYVFGTIPIRSPWTFVHKNPPFWSMKMWISLELLVQILKVSPFWNPLIKNFTLSYNWLLFKKLQMFVIQPIYHFLFSRYLGLTKLNFRLIFWFHFQIRAIRTYSRVKLEKNDSLSLTLGYVSQGKTSLRLYIS